MEHTCYDLQRDVIVLQKKVELVDSLREEVNTYNSLSILGFLNK